jgi:hypothetical protein
MLGSGVSTVVEHLTADPKIKGLNPSYPSTRGENDRKRDEMSTPMKRLSLNLTLDIRPRTGACPIKLFTAVIDIAFVL